uniref:Uncharacterized protein n=1 Tax=Clytia hemisphaerica TaxID=252671 RepID=A0A7M5WT86_9CNID
MEHILYNAMIFKFVRDVINSGYNAAKIVIGYQSILVLVFGFLLPFSPLLLLLHALKTIESLIYTNYYNACLLEKEDSLDSDDRIVLITVNGKILLPELKELFIRNVLDSHTVDGDFSFPNVTKTLQCGWCNKYWLDEKCFNISDHIKMVGETDEIYTIHDIPKLLNTVQKEPFENISGMKLSPWLINLAYVTENRTALIFKINQSLKDIEIIRALLSDSNYEVKTDAMKTIKKRENILSDYGYVNLFRNIGLSGWLMFRFISQLPKRKRGSKDHKDEKRVYFCSKSMDTTIFQQIGYHTGVSARYVILSCVSMAIEENISKTGTYCLSNFEFGAQSICQDSIALPAKLPSKPNKLDIKKYMQTLKQSISLDPAPCDVIFNTCLNRFAYIFIPVSLQSLLSSCHSFKIKVDLNSLDMEQYDHLVGNRIQSFSVWNEGFVSEHLRIIVTDSMNSVVVSTVSHYSKEDAALKFLKKFHMIRNQIAKEMGVIEYIRPK